LLFVRFTGPAGMKVSFFRGPGPGRTFAAPVAVGLRPGYIYRMELTGFERRPELTLAPTFEVRNTLVLPPGVLAANYPAPVTLTQDDTRWVRCGSLVTKVGDLEHPDQAEPVATAKTPLLETTVPADLDLLNEARGRGRPMLIVRVGQRIVSPDELAAC